MCFQINIDVVKVLSSRNDELPKRYRIDLNKPANQRWNQVLQDFSGSIPLVIQETKFVCIMKMCQLNDIYRRIVPSFLQRPLFWVGEKLMPYFDKDIAAEIQGIAEFTGLPLGEIVGVNILYDITDFDRWILKIDKLTSLY
ncbi:beta subunit of n-acylethanolamine-hydrolyzing acid amidase domain-containing protein [Ditylenchus destructor]|uniref:Beta subunit of n-acylethanolamine-hydrolyzing acid amidase domain-containing protein n=1 Tax=Ditylenchus destructor TaxID=166010 RepID=A0AAD4NIF6_9BILA|nr:beta subunit of n-acylethanolamine-hydrolyzing acid amidase domain-containing protein [Ditylenchus destructor]